MIVYTLFHETNTGHFDESDGYTEAVFETEALAESARRVAIKKAIEKGLSVYWDPETETENEHWDHDWRVEAHEVLTTVPETLLDYL